MNKPNKYVYKVPRLLIRLFKIKNNHFCNPILIPKIYDQYFSVYSQLPLLKIKYSISLYISVLAFIENIISCKGRTRQILFLVRSRLAHYSYILTFVEKNYIASTNHSSSFFWFF